ncbi:AAA family ATPase [Nitrosomonas communis]|uniref:AAA domain-containing protein n=1 Tax=Nitrosomonas communis TaxID=44574 RepID=A0A1I4SIJ7_9PROT|nr:AAA family ATPase [Nitrosomonas communis]SFM64262.1 AAA domain-containing protein [Nitrosomonas communis]
MSRKEISEVFTPRRSEVNANMYVERIIHEKILARSLKKNSHLLIFGESGNGKSWLYKKVLKDNSIPFVVANCANASRLNSLTQEIVNCIIEPGTTYKLGYSEEKLAEINTYFAKGGLKHNGKFEITQEEPLLKAFKFFSSVSQDKKVLVLDNLESIFQSSKLMDELADIIILLDDTRYATCNINLLIVGIPNGVLQYFRETKNIESVANRIQEIEKVSGLDFTQTREIIKKGFDQLEIKITLTTLNELAEHVWNVSLGIAQRVHEYCEVLAYEIEENNWKYDKSLLSKADYQWLILGLRQSYQVLEGHLNSRETSVARRNQVIYCIAKIRSHQFDSSDVDSLIRKEFPRTVPKTNMGIGSILSELTNGDTPLLIRNEKTSTYSIRDPRYLMCIRLILFKDKDSEKVIKKNFVR